MVNPLSTLVPKNFNAAKFILAAKPWANFAKTGRMVVGIGRNYALHAKARTPGPAAATWLWILQFRYMGWLVPCWEPPSKAVHRHGF